MTTSADPREQPLPKLRRKRRLDLPKLIGRFSDGVAEVDAQVERYAQRWDEANETARSADGPLWVALGDSSTQGIGASTWESGWTHDVLDRLRTASDEPWRLVNLAMSGGRFSDVANRQIPVLNTMLDSPALVTCVIGSNDLMWRVNRRSIYDDAERFADRVPHGVLLSKLNGPGSRPGRLNTIFEQAVSERDAELFNIWNWPSGRGALAADRVHPSDVGYDHMAELAWNAVAKRLGL